MRKLPPKGAYIRLRYLKAGVGAPRLEYLRIVATGRHHAYVKRLTYGNDDWVLTYMGEHSAVLRFGLTLHEYDSAVEISQHELLEHLSRRQKELDEESADASRKSIIHRLLALDFLTMDI